MISCYVSSADQYCLHGQPILQLMLHAATPLFDDQSMRTDRQTPPSLTVIPNPNWPNAFLSSSDEREREEEWRESSLSDVPNSLFFTPQSVQTRSDGLDTHTAWLDGWLMPELWDTRQIGQRILVVFLLARWMLNQLWPRFSPDILVPSDLMSLLSPLSSNLCPQLFGYAPITE